MDFKFAVNIHYSPNLLKKLKIETWPTSFQKTWGFGVGWVSGGVRSWPQAASTIWDHRCLCPLYILSTRVPMCLSSKAWLKTHGAIVQFIKACYLPWNFPLQCLISRGHHPFHTPLPTVQCSSLDFPPFSCSLSLSTSLPAPPHLFFLPILPFFSYFPFFSTTGWT